MPEQDGMYTCTECGEDFDSLTDDDECPHCGQEYVFPPVDEDVNADVGTISKEELQGEEDDEESVSEGLEDKGEEQQNLIYGPGGVNEDFEKDAG